MLIEYLISQALRPLFTDTARTDSYFVEAVMIGKMIGQRVFVVIVSCQFLKSSFQFHNTIIHKTPFFLQILPRGSIPALTTASPRAGSVLGMFSKRGELDMSLGVSSQREQSSWVDFRMTGLTGSHPIPIPFPGIKL